MTENAADRSPDDNLDPDKEARLLLNPPNESVQFTQNANSTNGQVVLPTANGGGVGLSKKELMKYANDPFWIRLRMFLFILFWVVWFAMLIGAILIIVFAPGCPATASLPWYKKCALVQVSVKPEGDSLPKQLESAQKQVTGLKDNLNALKESGLDGVLVSGLDPFLLANLENSNEPETNKFRDALVDLISTVHGDDVKAKILFDLKLTETPEAHAWFKEGTKNATAYSDFYLWQSGPAAPVNSSLATSFNSDKMMYYVRTQNGNPVLNYGSSELREKMKALIINWVRTKLDGIQTDGDFWEQKGDRAFPSRELILEAHKWIKTGGSNKALLVANSKLTPELVKEGEDVASFELAPDSSVWKDLSSATNLQEALKKAFSHYVQLEKDEKTAAANAPANATKPDVGAGWRTLQVAYPANENNPIAQKNGLSIAEGVLAATYLIPKTTPIVQIDGSAAASGEQLATVKGSKFLAKLDKLRKDNSESFLLGNTQLLTVTGSNEVFALSRVYKDLKKEENTFVLLINFSGTSQEVRLEGTLPDPATTVAKVVLTDSQHTESQDQQVNLSNQVKIQPKQVLLIEVAPKE